ncbi:MAG: DNA polymerase I [Clostridiaceae bacterium]|nr:DNA polymerase I [Clostridiaceae bacterium]
MKLMAIDGNSLVNRAFYGVKPLTAGDGTPTNAVYGFLNTFFKLREDLSPDAVCVCFDLKAKTFRHLEYEGYKAQRKPMPEELAAQIPLVKEALDLLGVPRMEKEGFEADDLLGTLARLCREGGGQCTIVTGDRDSLQFVAPGARVALVTTKMGQPVTTLYDEQKFAEDYAGLSPARIVDLKSLMGDSSDNIPGVRGIGEKGALALISRFGSLENLYAHLDDPDISSGSRKKLEEGRDMAFLSYKLALGVTDAPVDHAPAELVLKPVDEPGLYRLLSRLELRTIIKRLALTPPAEQSERAAFTFAGYTRLTDPDAVPPGTPEAVQVSADLSCCAFTIAGKTYAAAEDDLGEAGMCILLKSLVCDRPAVLHDGKPLLLKLLERRLEPKVPAFDTALADYLLDPSRGDYSIIASAARHLSCDLPPAVYDSADARTLLGLSGEALNTLAFHCACIAALRPLLEVRLREEGVLPHLTETELPLSLALARMQQTGMAVDRARLLEFGKLVSARLSQLEADIYRLAGREFTIGSPKQLGQVLFEELSLPSGRKTKTGYSTDADTLDKLKSAHEIVPAVLEWRKWSKLSGTYVEGLSKVIGPDGRIHSTFNQMVTATGRLSSTDPNLQNIPVRREDGSEIRRCFVPAPGWVLLDADYSQIELRVLASMANDAAMISAFESGEDIHAVTASQVFRVPLSEMTPRLRSRAKAVNFGIVYGISAFSLADDIGVTVREAQEYIDAYLAHYSGVRTFMEETKRKAREQGYVQTLYGRRRYLPELSSRNFNTRSFGERAAMNTPIQGTAADIMKRAMVAVGARLQREGLKARLVLQVHDELILESPPEEKTRAAALLGEEMERAAALRVRLPAEVTEGENWYDAKK